MFVCLFFYPFFFFTSASLSISIFTLVCLSTLLPVPASLCLSLSLHTCLHMCLSPIYPVSVTLRDFLVYQPHSLYFHHQFQPIYIPVSLSSSLSFPLKSVTYLQHSCLMNNGGETVTISISIRRIRFDLCYSPFPRTAFPHNFPPKFLLTSFLIPTSLFSFSSS